jgi:hypothetical protein
VQGLEDEDQIERPLAGELLDVAALEADAQPLGVRTLPRQGDGRLVGVVADDLGQGIAARER